MGKPHTVTQRIGFVEGSVEANLPAATILFQFTLRGGGGASEQFQVTTFLVAAIEFEVFGVE
jgi:hypothetical protein